MNGLQLLRTFDLDYSTAFQLGLGFLPGRTSLDVEDGGDLADCPQGQAKAMSKYE